MKKVKKLLICIIALSMILALAACGKKETPSDDGGRENTQTSDNTKADNSNTDNTKTATDPTPTKAPDSTDDPASVDPGNKFGDSLSLRTEPSMLDYVYITYYGVYCENTNNPGASFFFPYSADYMDEDTIDEQNCAFLYLSSRDDGKLCFLEENINTETAKTEIEGSKLTVQFDGKKYYGEIYWDFVLEKSYICMHIDEYNLWLSEGEVERRALSADLGADKTAALYFSVDRDTEFFTMYTALFGSSYSEFCDMLGRDDLMEPEDWQWWGKDLKVVYVDLSNETFACFFQYDRLVVVYRDAAAGLSGDNMYSAAVAEYGEPDNVYMYWSGYNAYEWHRPGYTYDQHVEVYNDNEAHYRQQITWSEYSE